MTGRILNAWYQVCPGTNISNLFWKGPTTISTKAETRPSDVYYRRKGFELIYTTGIWLHGHCSHLVGPYYRLLSRGYKVSDYTTSLNTLGLKLKEVAYVPPAEMGEKCIRFSYLYTNTHTSSSSA
jgi:hypothetical protein